MLDFRAQEDARDVLRLFFVEKLGRENGDHAQGVRVFRLEFSHIEKDMDAGDAHIGPEIE